MNMSEIFEAQDHMGYIDGEIQQTVDFDFDAVDRGAPLAAELSDANGHDPFPALAEALDEILRWVWKDDQSSSLQTATLRFVSLSAALNPQLFDGASYEQIAQQFGVTRAIISKHALAFQARFAIHLRRSKTAHSRESYRRAHLGLKRGQRRQLPIPGKESSKNI